MKDDKVKRYSVTNFCACRSLVTGLLSLLFLVGLWSSLWAYEIFPLQLTEKGKVLFSIEHASAKKVTLAGNFNDWNKDIAVLQKDELGIWYYELQLSPGKYEYKFVINDKDWIPSDNIKFELKLKQGQLVIEGGEGFKVMYEKKANLKVSDKIFINGMYKFIFIPYQAGLIKNRHILELLPQIYINENVLLYSSLSFDSENINALSLWRANLILNAQNIALSIFNNYRAFLFNDPLRSLDNYMYSSYYPLFSYPIEFYNADIKEFMFGNNYRGIVANIIWQEIKFKAFYSRPLFHNFDISGCLIKKSFNSSEIGFIALLEKGKYAYYPSPDSIEFTYNNAKFAIDIQTISLEDVEYSIRKLGPFIYWNLNKFLNIFAEYLSVDKQGGFYVKTYQSYGMDLPEDYPNYSADGGYKYTKYINFYNSSYAGDEFITGCHIFVQNFLKQELSFKYEQIGFKPLFLNGISPTILTYKSVTKLQFKKIKIGIELKLQQGDESLNNYNYGLKFDENNFYNKIIDGCYKKLTIRNDSDITVSTKWKFLLKVWYNKYFQQDIYFENDKRWSSDTIENYLICNYIVNKKAGIYSGMRFKNYNFNQYLEKNVFYSFKENYLNPFAGIEYKILDNFKLYLGYGIYPDIDEVHYDGFVYYLNENISNNLPFFKESEEKFADQHLITLKGEFQF